eukprot:scaffold43183_cov59-Phaeocystis_antarctica.AAC.3
MQQADAYGPAVLSHRTERVHQPSPVQPSGHRSEAGELTAGSTASGDAAAETVDCGGAACCRMSFAMAVWPLPLAHCSAVLPFLSSSSVLAPARSRICTHASCPPSPAAIIRAVSP